jgi:hypothetical protein
MYDRTTLSDGGGKDKNIPPITNQNRADWNQYVDYLDKKGLKGSSFLDKGDNAIKAINDYRKVNPNTTITPELITPIQNDFSNYRDYALNQVSNGKAQLAPGVNKDNFLSALSIVDGIPGQRTTSYKFPVGYMTDMNSKETKNKGFATTSQAPIDLLTSK